MYTLRERSFYYWIILAFAIMIGLLLVSLPDQADATSGDCKTYYNHSGFIPGSYDYGILFESGFPTITVETNGQDTYVAPPQGRRSWDKVKKCNYPTTTTTTTIPSTTTTTLPPTTTTVPESTTTSSPGSTTTTTLPREESTTTTTILVTTTIPSTQPVPPPITVTTLVTPSSPTLPATGTDADRAIVAGAVFLAVGALVLLFAPQFKKED